MCSYTHIILDEIHERSTEIDYALYITRKLADTISDLKIILVSATLQGILFIEYFRNKLGRYKVASPHFVGIKRFPVEVFFIDQLNELVSTREDQKQHDAMNRLQLQARELEENAAELLPCAPEVTTFTEEVCTNLIISQLSSGEAVLIFLSGLGDIKEFCNNIHNKLRRFGVRHRYRLFIFHSQVQSEDQDEAFQEPLEGKANIIVASRGSESSLTIPYLRLVINFGINKEMMYNSAKHISELSRQWCSRASCIQREGRVGRVSEGVAVHLFAKEFYETLPDFGPPEIIRIPLSKTFLRAKEIGPQLGVPLPSRLLSMVIEPPSFVQFSTALHDLAEYGAIAHNPHHKISEEADVTLLGKFSLSLPLDLNLSRLVLLGILFGCPLDGIVIAAAIAMYQDVFSMPTKIIMNDLHRFCHSLTASTFSRMKYDAGCYSNPIMMLNMFIDWLQYKTSYPHTSRRDLAFKFGSQNAVRTARLLHFEEFVGDIARCVANCIPRDTALYSELQTLSHISTEMKGFPVLCESGSFLYKASPPPGLLHFCNNYVILKALITAAAPDEILCGERACESSSPYSRAFAHKCINVIEKGRFSQSHTLCMDLSRLDEEEMQEIDETAFEALFENFPSDFDLSVEIEVVRDIAVLHFQPDHPSALTKTAKLSPTSKRKYSTAEISEIPPEVNFFWRFGEQNFLWEIDEVDAVFPAPSHPCALMWYRFDESKSRVNTVKFNFRNPTGFICQYDKPSQPYFAVATGAFVSARGSILAPRLTVLPNMPTSLMMVLAFQLPTSAIEFLINKENKTIKAIKINLVKIPCTDIEKYISSDEIRAINQVRKAISNVMALPLHSGCIPFYNPSITRIPKLLHDLLSSCKPNVSRPLASNLQVLPMDNRLEGLVWEKVTPGINIEDHSTSYYGEFRCSLVGTKPYAVKEVSHDQKPPQSTFPIEYTQSVSATLLAESKRILEQRREDALNDLLAENTRWRSPVSGKVSKKKVEREMKSERKDRKRAGKKASHLFCPLSPYLLEDALEEMVRSMYLIEEDKIRGKLERKRKKKEKRKAEKKVLLIQKEKVMGVEEANWRKQGKKKTEKRKRRKRKQGNKLPRSFSPLFSPSPSPLLSSPLSSPLFLSPLSSFPPVLPPPVSLCSSLPHPLSPASIVPFSPVGDQRFLHDKQRIVLSEYCSEFRQKQDLDAQTASTSKQKLPTQSDTEGLENSEDQTKSLLSVSQTVTTIGDGKQNVSKPLTTSTLHEEAEKTCLTTAESNPSACGEREKTSLVAQTKSEMSQSSNTETMTETANRCQLEVEVSKVSHTKGLLKETADSSSKQKVASKVALNKISDQHSTGEHMAQLDVDFKSECGGQTRLKKEASLKETGKVQNVTEAPCSEKRVEGEKTQKEEVVLSKEKLEREKEAAQKGRENKIEAAISEEKVMSENEHAVKENKEERKSVISELERVERKKEQEKIEVQKEREVSLCEKEKVEKEKQTTLRGNEKLSREEEALREENIIREKQKKRRRRRKKKTEIALATSSSEQNPPKSGIAGPDTCEESQMRSVLSVSQFVPANGQPQTATKGTFLEDKGKGSLTAATSNATLPDERKKTSPETQTKSEMSENGSIESMTEMAKRCQTEIEVLKGTHTKTALNETSVSDITPTEQKAASKVAPNRNSAQCNMDERMAQFSVSFINECGGQTRLATLREEAPLTEKDLVQKERETAMNEKRIETEEKITLEEKEVGEATLSEKEREKEIATKEKEERAALSRKEKEKRKKEEESDEIQKKREVALCKKERVEREKEATLKEREKKIEAAISEEKVMSEYEHAVKENEEERKSAMSELERVERKKEQEKIEVQKEREVVLCKKEKVEKEKQTTLRGNEKLSREEKALSKEEASREEEALTEEQALSEEEAAREEEAVREENVIREKRKKRRRKRKKKTEVALATSSSEQNPPKSGIAGPDTCEESQMRSVLSVSQYVPANGQPQTATKDTTFLEDKRKGSLTAAMSNATVPDERKKTSPKTQTKSEMSENRSIESMTEMANRCQIEIGVLKGTHTKKPLNETSVSDNTPTEQKTASKVAPNRASVQCNIDERMAHFSVGFINECGGQIRLATLREEAPHREKDIVQKERETLKENKTLKTEEAEVKEEDEKREKRKAKRKKEENEREKKEAPLAATNSEQEPLAHSGIAQPKGRLVASVSQTVPTVGSGKKSVSKSVTAPIGTNVCSDEGKRPLTILTGHHERKKTGPEPMSQNGSTKSTTRTSQSKIEVMKVIQAKKPLKETAVSGSSPIMQKAASRVASKRNKPQPGTSEQFSVSFINKCGGQTRLAVLREEAPHREKDIVQQERETAMNEKRLEPEKKITLKKKEVREAALSEKETEKEIATKEKVKERAALSDREREKRKKEEESDEIQKEREAALCKKKRVEREKQATLKENKTLKTEEAEVKEEDEKREKRKAKRKKEENEREKKEAPLAATNSEQEPLAHSAIAQPKGRSVASVSQTVPTVGSGKKSVSKSVTAPIGTNVCTDEGKRPLTIPTDHHERKKTGPEPMSQNGSTKSTTRTSQSKIEVMKVTQAKKPLKETSVSDGSPIMQKAASRVDSKRNKAQPGTSEHMAQFLADFINECGGQTRLATLRRVAFPQYQEKYYGQYTFLSKGFLRKYECFQISEDSSGVCHVRVVGAKRQSLVNTEPEKMEHMTKKCLSYKPVCDIKMRNISEDTRALDGNFHSVPGSSEDIVQYLYSYLSTHFFPYGCPVSSLDALYQNEYKPKFSHSQVEMINADFLKEFSSRFVLEVGRTFVKLKEGVDHNDTSPLKGCPYTLQHVNDYFRRYLAQEGVVCTQQLRVLFSECYMKEFKMPQKPIIQFVQEDFFKRSSHLFVTFADLVVFRK